MTDIRDLLAAGAHRPAAGPDLDRIARDATRKRTVRWAAAAAAVIVVVALVAAVDWPGTSRPAITDPVGTVTVTRLPRVDPSAEPGEMPATVTVLEGTAGQVSWTLGAGIDMSGSMLHLLFSTGSSSAAVAAPLGAPGRVGWGSLTANDRGRFVYGVSVPEVVVFDLDLADGSQVQVEATRVTVADPPVVFTAFATPVAAEATRITGYDRTGDIVAVFDRDDPVGVALFQVLQDQPWLGPLEDSSTRPPFDPVTFQDQYLVVTSVASDLFGDRAAGGRLAGSRIELAVTDATAADTARLQAELATDPRLADAADRTTIVPIEHTRAELEAAQQRLTTDLPDGLLQRITVAVEPLQDRVTLVVADDNDAAAIRDAIPDLPDFVHIVIDPNQQPFQPASS